MGILPPGNPRCARPGGVVGWRVVTTRPHVSPPPLPAGLSLRRPPVAGPDEPADDLLEGWYQAVARGFHQGRLTAASRQVWLDHLREDAVRPLGVWEETPALEGGALPVATYSSYDKELTTGAGTVPARMISDVTVAPTHRRRGLLRTIITTDLRDAAAAGVPVAVLTASEGSIYGRFGFGPATHEQQWEVDTSARYALRGPAPAGRVVLLEPAEAWPHVDAVFARWHARQRGSLPRPRFYESMLSGAWNPAEGGPDHRLRVAVHLDAAGEPDGHVAYRVEGERGVRTVDVVDLVTLGPSAHRALWRFLADLDLVGTVRWGHAGLADPLPWSLVEPRAVRVVGQRDSLWVRLVDVPAALEARPWFDDGSVVLEVADPLGLSSGRWRLTSAGGRATCEATDAEAGVRLEADTLGALYLGGTRLETLSAAGRVAGSPAAVHAFAAMVDGGPPPHSLTDF